MLYRGGMRLLLIVAAAVIALLVVLKVLAVIASFLWTIAGIVLVAVLVLWLLGRERRPG
jgi:hypothetical protein